MNHTLEVARAIVSLALCAVALGAGVVWTIKKAEDPGRMIFRWVITLPVVGYLFWVVAPLVGKGGYGGAFGGIPLAAVCGLVLAIIWRGSIAGLVARSFASLYDGGDIPPEPKPLYSVARARQKQGKYLEAVAEIRQQLSRFPTDVEGHMLLAEIQAQDLKDLPAAELTIDHFCRQPGHAPQNIVFALYALADWHLSIGQDREAARGDLQRVIDMFPGSEYALGAAQRIAHLASTDMLLAPHENKRFAVPEGPRRLGLAQAQQQSGPVEIDPAQKAAEYVQHLEEHPLDMEAREQLALIYADHYGRLDLATDQLEQMIAEPGQPGRLVVHWLNLLADLQIRCGGDHEMVRQTLQRIIDRDPNGAAAEIARNRLALVKLEMKGQARSEPVKLGSYEQNIGLKRRGPPG